MNFTQAQQHAIGLRGRNILVSAAAGSGKTATLTQRIIGLLTDTEAPADIQKMLIVTFTRAAAGELRSRVSAALSSALAANPGNSHLTRQLTSLGSAQICTIDSFYLDLVRANFQRLGLPSSFRLADESELEVLRRDTMNSVIERFFDSDPEFGEFCDNLTGLRGEGQLADILLKLASRIIPSVEGCAALGRYANQYDTEARGCFFDSRSGKIMLGILRRDLLALCVRCDALLNLTDANTECTPYAAALRADRTAAAEIVAALDARDYAGARSAALEYSPLPLGRIAAAAKSEMSEAIRDERAGFKALLLKLSDAQFALSEDDIRLTMLRSAAVCRKCEALLTAYNDAYTEEKNNRSVCEFADLRRYMLQLLVRGDGSPTDIALAQQARYSHIFVDEYQDTDGVQDLIFRAVSDGHNLFMVGDIKQSIYSFRGADPSVFAAYRRAYPRFDSASDPEPESPCSVFMSENFRCARPVIDFTNAVCSYLFSESERGDDGGGIGYTASDDLIFARQGDVPEIPVRLVMIEKDTPDDDLSGGADDASAQEYEIRYVVGEIRKLLADGTKPGDIAVLARSKSSVRLVSAALARAGIPHANSDGEDLLENPEVLLNLCLLSAADNPQRDVPLAGALRSPVFGFTLTDLVKIRHGRTRCSLYDSMTGYASDADSDTELAGRCRAALARLDRYRAEAEAVPVHRFLRYLWRDINALTYAGSSPDSKLRTPAERRRNLQRLYEYARRYEASAFHGLHDFVEYVNGLIEAGTKISSEDAADSSTVRVMTVHKSKGLEFPVVFLIGTASRFNEQDSRAGMVYTPSGDLGLTVRLCDTTGFGQIDPPMRIAAAARISELAAEEEMRVLYVALTRARDRLVITCSGAAGANGKRFAAAARRNAAGGRSALLGASCWLDWLLTATAAGRGTGSFVTEEISSLSLADGEGTTAGDEAVTPPDADPAEVARLTDIIRRRIAYRYPYSAVTGMPAKLSVSRLYPEALDGDDGSDTGALLERAERLTPRVPRFMGGEADAAQRGTATHLFMQFCDFSSLDGSPEAVENEIARLSTSRFIPPDAAALIRANEVTAFSRSHFFSQLRQAKSLYREQRFNVFLPAADFTSVAAQKAALSGEKLLVQGVIDLFFTDSEGRLVLCDYKTDRLTRAERADMSLAAARLRGLHGEQLGYYASALERLCGRKPDRICIYSLHLGEAVDIELPKSTET